MPDKFIINGQRVLRGEVEVRGAKNAALPILASTLLTKEPCVIDNLPLIEDVFRIIDILKGLGAEVFWLGERKLKIQCKDINPAKLPQKIVGNLRGSILILGPLLTRFDNIKMLSPGGCIIGARPLDAHFDAFLQLGINNYSKGDFYYFKKNKAPSTTFSLAREKVVLGKQEVVLQEFSVTATENTLLFASALPQKTVIKIADQDYQVQELCKVLKKMGAKIKMSGPHIFEVEGKEKLKGFSHYLISDPIEAGAFVVAALITKGEVLVKNAEVKFLTLFLKKLKNCGANIEILGPRLIKVLPSNKLVIDKIQSLPYPGIHTDLQPYFGVLATQTKGATLIHDPLYEGRLKYLEELNKMGGEIIFCDPHRAIVNGPTILHGIEIPSLDLRAGAALIIAGLVARGTTTINNIYQIDRGYEKIEERLQKLGADIKRVSS
jgi:UDP-N-acetylglucosamine 1-carboxyvinyltransferase